MRQSQLDNQQPAHLLSGQNQDLRMARQTIEDELSLELVWKIVADHLAASH